MASPTRRSLSGQPWSGAVLWLRLLFEENSEWQPVSNLNRLDHARAEPCKVFEEIDVLALEYEIRCFELGSGFAVRVAKLYVFHHAGGWVEDRLTIADCEVFDPAKIGSLQSFQ
jgi:hypothetical protein